MKGSEDADCQNRRSGIQPNIRDQARRNRRIGGNRTRVLRRQRCWLRGGSNEKDQARPVAPTANHMGS